MKKPDIAALFASDWTRWHRILAAHYTPSAPLEEARAPSHGLQEARSHVRVVIIDRPSDSTALVRWSSSVGCHYAEQIWRKVIARKAGVCALSGLQIARGDLVFRPLRPHRACSNATAMISALSLDDATVRRNLPVISATGRQVASQPR